MNYHDAFLRAILESPEDDTPRLVYADWLEEQGDPRGEFIRVQCLLARIREGDPQRRSLQRRERELLGEHGPKWQGPLRHLAGPLQFRRGFLLDSHWREGASRLAGTREAGELLGMLRYYANDPQHTEVAACLAQELTLRGVPLANAPFVEPLLARLEAIGHPLAALPLALTALEDRLGHFLRHYYDEQGSCWSCPHSGPQPGEEPRELPPHGGRLPVSLAEVNDPATIARMLTAVRNWQEESNGQAEARIFRAGQPLGPEHLSLAWLRRLGLCALAGAEESDVRASTVGPARVLEDLFVAANCGGAYNQGRYGAYGRLEAWQSLGALAGARPEASISALSALAKRCTWVAFSAQSDWYYNIANDIGLLAL
jgi:uncharacterized protein (TIGR02996 family)